MTTKVPGRMLADDLFNYLPSASLPLTGTEEIPLVQGAGTKTTTSQGLAELARSITLATAQTFTAPQEFQDDAAAAGSCVAVEHFGDGSGPGGAQVYGLDIHNNPGAKQALVVHQYSAAQPAVQIDNTDAHVSLVIKNTNNPTRNPTGAAVGASATGGAISLVDTSGNPMFRLLGRGEVLLNGQSDATTHALEVVGHASSVRRLIRTTMNGAAVGVEFIAAAGAAGFYPFQVIGYDYGPHFSTSQDGASRTVLQLTKSGSGAGIGLQITNSGTGKSVVIRNATVEVFGITAAGIPQWTLAANQQTTVGAAGGASALPATPTKYLKVVDSAGTTFVVPAYAAS